jgi:predicted nucleic acid-binding protein
MTIEQIIDIQADHRLVLELPREIPIGRATVAVTVTPQDRPAPGHRLTPRQLAAIEKCRGIAKGVLSSDEILENRRKDKELEDAQLRRLFHMDDLPIDVINTVSNTVYRETARFKTGYSMSLADAFLCATAKSLSAAIVTRDGEIRPVEQQEKLSVLWIN